MTKTLTVLSLLVFLSFLSWGQGYKNTLEEDYNQDNVKDQLEVWIWNGSDGAGTNFTFTDGRTQEKLVYSYSAMHSQLRVAHVFPPEFRKPQYQKLREEINNHVVPDLRSRADPSLNWILYGLHHQQKRLSSSRFINEVIHFPVDWQKGAVKLPGGYGIKRSAADLKKEFNNLNPSGDPVPNVEGYINYRAANLYQWCCYPPRVKNSKDTIRLVDSFEELEAHKVSHGLIVKNKEKNTYLWAFISDEVLTGAPAKLRFESIQKVAWASDRYLFIRQVTPPAAISGKLFLIDIQEGKCAVINPLDPNNQDIVIDFFLDKDQITIEKLRQSDFNKSTESYALKEIYEELAQYK